MGRKSKYTPETIELIVEAIQATGADTAGIEAGHISQDTFYRWISEKPEFSEKIHQAKQVFRSTRPKLMREKATKRLAEYLDGTAVERWHWGETITNDRGEVSVKEAWREIRRPCPQWVIDRVLGKSMPVLEAVQVLLNEGVATPAQAALVESHLDAMQRELRQLANSEESRAKLEKILESNNTNEPVITEKEVVSPG